jgi:alkylation response protein AidB-like acyl-CoA dehydrogenase
VYFDLTDDQKQLQRSLEALLSDKLPDSRQVPHFDTDGLDRALWTALVDLGLTATMVPERDGGLEMDLLTLASASEVLGRFGAPAPIISTALAAWILSQSDDADQKACWLPGLLSGQTIAAFAFAEPGLGWLNSDWTLSHEGGEKVSVEWGADADLLVVGLAGGGLGLADARGGGVSVTAVDTLDRTRPLAQASFSAGAITPLAQSAQLAARARDALLVLLAADALGAASRAVTMAVEYAKVRSQFGRLIGSFQALKHQLANMAIEVEPCRPLYWYAAHAWDAIPEVSERTAALAKSHITDIAVRTARAAVEAHGGIGYTWEYPLHIFLKRAMFDRTAMGSPATHHDRMALMAGW